MNIPEKKPAKTIGNSCFCLKNDLFRYENGPLWTTPTSNFGFF